MNMPQYEPETKKVIELFIKQYLEQSGADGYVVGLSGGLDSSVACAMAVRAVGKERVLGMILPTVENQASDEEDALALAEELEINCETLEIDRPRNELADLLDVTDPRHVGNITARLRMTVLFHVAKERGLLVLGTSNKSEMLTGYFTKFGDGASDIDPLGDLYKTQIYGLAYDLNIPTRIIEKPPSAGLEEGQTDEDDLGMEYEELDAILVCIEKRMPMEDAVEETGLNAKEVERVYRLVERTIHKRRLGLIPKIGLRTVGTDWREV